MSLFAPRTLISILGIISLAGCARAPEQATPPPGPSFETLLNSPDASKASEWFTDDAALLPSDLRRVDGKEAVVQYYKDLASSDLWYKLENTGLTSDHNLAVGEGTYSIRNVKTEQEIERGKFIVVLKHVDQGWRVYRLMTNSDTARAKTDVTVGEPQAVR